ncbi:zinc finger protein 91-like isoform X2 [Aedes albopictus]|uniref:C2h2-type zn-finger protein n=1 Tax=Aedes albopictus TaxID=7160 RepID=A0ABM1XZZ4_AEDAL
MASKTVENKSKRKNVEICRLCMSTESLEDVFEVEDLRQWISDYLSILVSFGDNMSHVICTICRIRLAEFHQFRMRCEEVQTTLLSMGQAEEVEEEEEQEEVAETPKVAYRPRSGASIRQPDPIKGVLEVGDQYHCETCGKVFDERRPIMDHIRIHGPKKYVCMHCGKAYPIRRYLNLHLRCHRVGRQKRLEQEFIENNQHLCQSVKVEPDEEIASTSESQRSVDPLERETICEERSSQFKDEKEGSVNNTEEANSESAVDRIEIGHVKIEKPSDDDDTETKSTASKTDEIEPCADQRDLHSEFHVKNEEITLDSSKDWIKTEVEEMDDDSKDDANDIISDKDSSLQPNNADSHLSTQQENKMENTLKEQQHPCDQCSRVYSTKQKLRDHLRLVHGEKKHVCPVCGKGYVLASQLRLHVVTHSKATPFKCNMCEMSFKHGQTLSRHKSTQHSSKQNFCIDCGLQFAMRRQLDRHFRTRYHRMTVAMKQSIKKETAVDKSCSNSSIGEGVYQCDECPKKCLEKQQIKDHKRLVHGERKLACPVCGKRFVIPSQLQNHVRMHNRKYRCDMCTKSFHEECSLWSHRRLQHNIKEVSIGATEENG